MSDWIKESAEKIVIEWPRIDVEAGVIAQNAQDSFAGHAYLVDALAEIIEVHFERFVENAVPVDLRDLLDQAQDEIRTLRTQLAAERAECVKIVLADGDGVDRLETAITYGPNAAIAEAILARGTK